MIDGGRTRRCGGMMAALAALALAACGSDAGLNISNPNRCARRQRDRRSAAWCEMPNGRVARDASMWDRVASAVVARGRGAERRRQPGRAAA